MESYNTIVKTLRKEELSLRARLQSIVHDNRFVSQFENFPLVANERCGLWYLQPNQRHGSVYFKSTDGHTGQWQFLTRRLNFQLLPILGENGTVVVVDSTRKGKLMPDALLKTVPIWCAVLNYIMFDGATEEVSAEFAALQSQNWLLTPREMVSESEHHSIAARVPVFADEVLKLKLTSRADLIERLGANKPLVPRWVYPGRDAFEHNDKVFTVCCLTASARKWSGWNYPLAYIQGSGDDHELWATKDLAQGHFDHEFFWDHVYYEPLAQLRVVDMATGDIDSGLSEEQFIARINEIYKARALENGLELNTTPLGSTGIHMGKIASDTPLRVLTSSIPGVQEVIVLSPNFDISGVPENLEVVVNIYKIELSKKGAKLLREKLADILANYTVGRKVAVFCDSGTDLSAGICLCFLSKWYTRQWEPSNVPLHVNKDVVKQHLSKIQDYCHVNPSRNTLQSVNTYLMGSR